MKRDMDLIRLLLIENESGEAPPELKDYTDEEQLYNLQLMSDANLIVASFMTDASATVTGATIQRMTWAGHDFLDAARDNTLWKKVKTHVLKPGASWTFQALGDYLKKEIEQRLSGAASDS